MSVAVSEPSEIPSQQYTILRIKRKRHEEPITALFYDLESTSPTKERGRKKLKIGGEIPSESGLFRLAETVDETQWEATKKSLRVEELRDRINTSEQAESPEEIGNNVLGQPQSTDMDVDVPRRVYRIMPRRRSSLLPRKADSQSLNGQMASVPETDQDMPPFDLFDAELVPEKAHSEHSRAGGSLKSEPRRKSGLNIIPKGADEAEERQMAVFADMVERFLEINTDALGDPRPLKKPTRTGANPTSGTTLDSEAHLPPTSVNRSRGIPRTAAAQHADQPPDGLDAPADDYVYDIFVYSPGEAADVHRMKLLKNGQIGALMGIEELYEQRGESDGEGEVDSEVDEDSNDEGYYRNDYPDDDEDWSENEDNERRERFESGGYAGGALWEDRDDDWHDADSD